MKIALLRQYKVQINVINLYQAFAKYSSNSPIHCVSIESIPFQGRFYIYNDRFIQYRTINATVHITHLFSTAFYWNWSGVISLNNGRHWTMRRMSFTWVWNVTKKGDNKKAWWKKGGKKRRRKQNDNYKEALANTAF